ncbi:MAG: hypothetical protein OQK98_14425 [Gammaproteobacteria bacterium]|nr:hypothetical protein [Gammaproteobacteria bacterium]
MIEDVLNLTEEEKLKHEVGFLKTRLENIEKFKTYFFQAKTDLIIARERVSTLENELVLSDIKKTIMNSGETEYSAATGNNSVLDFIKESMLLTGYKDLVDSIFRLMDGLNLVLAVNIHGENDDHIYLSNKDDKEDNIHIMNKYKEQGEFMEVAANQLILNLENISVLIKGLPDEKSENYKKIKDFSMMVFVSSNLRLASLNKETELEGLKHNMYKIFKKTRGAFEATQDLMDGQVIEISEMMLNYEKNLKDSLHQMSMPESYIKSLLMLFHSTKSDLNILLTGSLCIDEKFLKAIIKLEKAYGDKYSGIEL